MFQKCTKKLPALFRLSMVQSFVFSTNYFNNDTEINLSQASLKSVLKKNHKFKIMFQLVLKHCISTTQLSPFDYISDLTKYNMNLMLCVTQKCWP